MANLLYALSLNRLTQRLQLFQSRLFVTDTEFHLDQFVMSKRTIKLLADGICQPVLTQPDNGF